MRILKIALLVLALGACTRETTLGRIGDGPENPPVIVPKPNEAGGGVDGGGGNAVVCRDESGKITSAELLDFYEGRAVHGLTILESSDPVESHLKSVIDKIPGSVGGLVKAYLKSVQKAISPTPDGVELLPINDSFEVIVPKDCEVEQAANYRNEKKVIVNGEIWAALNNTGKAGLIVHEAIYAINRLVGATNSRQSRHITASLFDLSTFWVDPADGLVANDILTCVLESGGAYIWAYRLSKNSWKLQFNAIGKSYVYSKKTAILYGPEFNLNEAKEFPVLKGDGKVGEYILTVLQANSLFEDEDTIIVKKAWESPVDQSGNTIPGYQMPVYYLSWKSKTHPSEFTDPAKMNCSVEL